jgi:hypothetical protein
MDERLPLDKEMGQLCVKGPYIQPLCAGSFFEEEITAQLWLLHRAGASPRGFPLFLGMGIQALNLIFHA